MAKVASFGEAVKLFEDYRKSKGIEGRITREQLSKLREAFKAGKIEVATRSDNKDGYVQLLKEYSGYKKQQTGDGTISLKERIALRKGMAKLDESIPAPTPEQKVQYQKLLKEFSNYKLETKGDSTVTATERNKLKEAVIAESKSTQAVKTKAMGEYRKLLREFAEYKFKKTGEKEVTLTERTELRKAVQKLVESKPASKATDDQIKAVKTKLNEARFKVFKGNRALKEGDIPAAGDAAAGAMDAMGGAADAAGGAQLPPDVTQKIQALQTAVNDLASAAGIQPPVDMGADAAAGVPADTSAGVDPNAAGAPAPAMESQKFDIEAAKRRIKEREAKLAEMNGKLEEHVGAQKVANQTVDDIKNLGADHSFGGAQLEGGRRIATSNPPSQGQGQGSTAEAIKGSPSAAKTWPTKPGPKELAKGGATSQSTNINESAKPVETTKESLKETDLAEAHVDKIMTEEKLNFKDLFGKGSILG